MSLWRLLGISVDWFEQIAGFAEASYAQTQSRVQ